MLKNGWTNISFAYVNNGHSTFSKISVISLISLSDKSVGLKTTNTGYTSRRQRNLHSKIPDRLPIDLHVAVKHSKFYCLCCKQLDRWNGVSTNIRLLSFILVYIYIYFFLETITSDFQLTWIQTTEFFIMRDNCPSLSARWHCDELPQFVRSLTLRRGRWNCRIGRCGTRKRQTKFLLECKFSTHCHMYNKYVPTLGICYNSLLTASARRTFLPCLLEGLTSIHLSGC